MDSLKKKTKIKKFNRKNKVKYKKTFKISRPVTEIRKIRHKDRKIIK